jgi:hypothetical protein
VANPPKKWIEDIKVTKAEREWLEDADLLAVEGGIAVYGRSRGKEEHDEAKGRSL